MTLAVSNSEALKSLLSSSYQGPVSQGGRRLRVVWANGNVETELEDIAGFAGTVSYRGSQATLTVAWPEIKNPRTVGAWQEILVPNDNLRIKVFSVVGNASGDKEIPLLTGVPSPEGVRESYTANSGTIEIKVEDVTGVASRITSYLPPFASTETVEAKLVANAVLNPLEPVILFNTEKVSACNEIFPNALMAADEVLIKKQAKLLPLTGEKRIRYGDRNGKIVYTFAQEPDAGKAFRPSYPAADFQFAFNGGDIVDGLLVDSKTVRFSLPLVNPYIDLGMRLKLDFQRGVVSEIVEVYEIGWRVMPKSERMTIKARRQLTI